MLITFILLLWLIPIVINVYIDRYGKKPHYSVVFIFRGGAAIIHGIIFDVVFDYFPNDWSAYNYWDTFLVYLPLLTFWTTSFWILFEIALNIAHGRNEILYYDRREGDSGWIDRFFKLAGPTAHLIAKILALIACVLSIINLYQTA